MFFSDVFFFFFCIPQIVLDENPVLDELSVEYVPQIGFLTALHRRYSDLAPPDFSFAFAQVGAKNYVVTVDYIYVERVTPRKRQREQLFGSALRSV